MQEDSLQAKGMDYWREFLLILSFAILVLWVVYGSVPMYLPETLHVLTRWIGSVASLIFLCTITAQIYVSVRLVKGDKGKE